ncbi:hypothetical protein WI40_11570 [Burkholderia ubonensis]|nr:hypothetical protein WI40_11570 [Burkholderia ubonensis]
MASIGIARPRIGIPDIYIATILTQDRNRISGHKVAFSLPVRIAKLVIQSRTLRDHADTYSGKFLFRNVAPDRPAIRIDRPQAKAAHRISTPWLFIAGLQHPLVTIRV